MILRFILTSCLVCDVNGGRRAEGAEEDYGAQEGRANSRLRSEGCMICASPQTLFGSSDPGEYDSGSVEHVGGRREMLI